MRDEISQADQWTKTTPPGSFMPGGAGAIIAEATPVAPPAAALREPEAHALRRLRDEAQQFAYAIAHDLKSPVNTLHLLMSELLDLDGDLSSDEGRELADLCRETLIRISDTIDTLLSMATEDAPAEPSGADVDLAHLMQEVRNDLAAEIRRTQGRILGAGALPVVQGDAPKLRLVLQNLVGNALKYHRPDVPPVVRLRSRATADGMIAIDVIDNGRGIPAVWQQRVFLPLQRAGGVADIPGTGLGLTLCRRIIERHGGLIELRSLPGSGSTFTIFLPGEVAR